GAGPLRCQDRRLLRWPSGRPRQPEPGGRVDPLLPPGPRGDEAGGEHAGHPPPRPGQLRNRPDGIDFASYPSLDTEVRSQPHMEANGPILTRELDPAATRTTVPSGRDRMRRSPGVRRTGIVLKPSNSRVVIRPFELTNEKR